MVGSTGEGVRGRQEVKGVKYMMTGDETLGGEYRNQYTDDVLHTCTPKTYLLLTSVTPIYSVTYI